MRGGVVWCGLCGAHAQVLLLDVFKEMIRHPDVYLGGTNVYDAIYWWVLRCAGGGGWWCVDAVCACAQEPLHRQPAHGADSLCRCVRVRFCVALSLWC